MISSRIMFNSLCTFLLLTVTLRLFETSHSVAPYNYDYSRGPFLELVDLRTYSHSLIILNRHVIYFYINYTLQKTGRRHI